MKDLKIKAREGRNAKHRSSLNLVHPQSLIEPHVGPTLVKDEEFLFDISWKHKMAQILEFLGL